MVVKRIEGSQVTRRRHARLSGKLQPDPSRWPSPLRATIADEESGKLAPATGRAGQLEIRPAGTNVKSIAGVNRSNESFESAVAPLSAKKLLE